LSSRRFALDTRIATVGLALVLVFLSMPVVSGWTVNADSRCCVTTDICHPLQAADTTRLSVFGSPTAVLVTIEFPRDATREIANTYRAMSDRLSDAPNAPPPKFLA